ncbi:ThuA domain-containing protein [Paenibacillus radicis (ex Gao et al. 2016)]|uniref:Trehalose utilization protein ThuA n=1 Tax=Paenibacillus radicis (ex Gao et al. 2016) TaxID=1737354 RepID=A0A917GS75_9BACL|nr:ThuA domain-containing protein [Paenibacillus radicis (ex Gao et al. 2016)]GGG54883.1 trehalose utilization protein ThuA [Paenibacillus radicis (ex Gao et al. 2016)]
MAKQLNVTIWNEFRHEKTNPEVTEIYPNGIHQAIGKGITGDVNITYAVLDDPEHGLTEEVLNGTDVLLWWGHMAHGDVQDEIVERVHNRVLQGMGLIVLHSGHFSKIFKKLMGTSCDLKWREAGEKERLWVVNPGHPIAAGIGEYIELEQEEMYGEHFDIPQPDELVFVSWFEGGEVFRSGCCYTRGNGKVFYFRPGHETHPTYYNADVRKVISNAVQWAAPVDREYPRYGHVPVSIEPIKAK